MSIRTSATRCSLRWVGPMTGNRRASNKNTIESDITSSRQRDWQATCDGSSDAADMSHPLETFSAANPAIATRNHGLAGCIRRAKQAAPLSNASTMSPSFPKPDPCQNRSEREKPRYCGHDEQCQKAQKDSERIPRFRKSSGNLSRECRRRRGCEARSFLKRENDGCQIGFV